MVNIFELKKGDTSPALAVTLNYSNGSAIDLTGATSILFNMGNLVDYSAYTSGNAVILGSTLGTCEYRWTGSVDTGSVGTYWGEFEVNWPGGSKLTMPTDHSLQIKIAEDYN